MIEQIEAGSEVMLVDHNEFQQSAEGIAEAAILAVVDHHRIANFETANHSLLPCRTCWLYEYDRVEIIP